MSVNNTYTQRALPNTLIDARFYKSYVHFFLFVSRMLQKSPGL